eukprot:13452861-Ditylum_brightwellii.AAC.1
MATQEKLFYGISFSAFQYFFQMGESTSCLCVSKLSRSIVNTLVISDIHAQKMAREDAKKVVVMYKEVQKINGMVGSLDVMKLHWDNYPTVWKE